jgi:hypothetical protein
VINNLTSMAPFPCGRRHVVRHGLMTMTHLMDFEERARAVLPPHISAYYAAAAVSGPTAVRRATRSEADQESAAF